MRIESLRRLALWLTCLSVVAYMTISPSLLFILGIPYDVPNGNFLFKLHPGTYLLTAAWFATMLARGNVIAASFDVLARNKVVAFYTVSMVFLFFYSLARYGFSGSAFVIETLMMPALALMILLDMDRDELRAIYKLAISLLVINAVIAIGEALVQQHLVPETIAGQVVVSDIFRSNALIGHPLNNAIMTGTLLFTLFDLPYRRWRTPVVVCLWLALLAFGGRTSFLVTTVLLCGYLLWLGARGLINGRYGYVSVLRGLLLAMALFVAMLVVVATTGLGERIFGSIYFDDSSAVVRVQSLLVFNYMNAVDIIFGMSPADILGVANQLGLTFPSETIENFWVVMLMQFGVVGMMPFVAGLLAVFIWLGRRQGTGARYALLIFLVVSSSNNSLAAKSCTLTLLFIVLEAARGYSTRVRAAQAARDLPVAPSLAMRERPMEQS